MQRCCVLTHVAPWRRSHQLRELLSRRILHHWARPILARHLAGSSPSWPRLSPRPVRHRANLDERQEQEAWHAQLFRGKIKGLVLSVELLGGWPSGLATLEESIKHDSV